MNAAALNRAIAAVRAAVPVIPSLQPGERGKVVGRYYGANITSAFQPWRDGTGAPVAIEAYARSHSKRGEDLSPWQLFADNAVDNDLVTLDRLCRTVHALNHFAAAGARQPLVLNVDARLLQAVPERHGEFFGKVLSALDVAPGNIVIEIRTVHQFDLTRLRQVVASYRRHGFVVAVNAESAIHARALAELLAPDVLMLDALGFSPEGLRRHVAALVGADTRIAVKRIESAAHADAAGTAGAAWVQGYYFDELAVAAQAVAAL